MQNSFSTNPFLLSFLLLTSILLSSSDVNAQSSTGEYGFYAGTSLFSLYAGGDYWINDKVGVSLEGGYRFSLQPIATCNRQFVPGKLGA